MSGDGELEILEFSPTEARGWLRILPFAGAEARAWAENFRSAGGEGALEALDLALKSMRERRLEEGQERLEACASRHLAALAALPGSLAATLDGWYYSAEAYLHYCRNQPEEVFASFERQSRALLAAIEEAPFLVILASRFCDLALQKALVARNLHRWEEVERQIAEGREMLDNRRPLCTLGRGEIYYSHLEEALARLLREQEAQQAARKIDLSKVVDPRWRHAKFKAIVAETYALPWMLVPYG
jgi:hypothetical protein